MAFDDDLVLGIELGGRKIFAALVDDGGRVHGEHVIPAPWDPRQIRLRAEQDDPAEAPGDDERTPVGPRSTGDGVLDKLADLARRLLLEAESSGSRVRGVGVGVPGVTTPDGLVVSAPALGWRKMRLGARLSDELDLPVRVDSDVNLAALGELRFGAGRGARDLVWVTVGQAVAAALILDGRLYRGHRGAAGALGGLLPGTSFLEWGEPIGPLESLISSAGIADRARVLADSSGLPLPPDGLRPEDVFAAAAEGTGWACAVLDETIDYLAVALSAVQALLDPERVVLGGSAVIASDTLLPALVRRMATLPNPPRLVPSELGARAAVLGAAVAARDGL
jgi:predicted NBD/HSP70 family sugar kinase